MFLIADNAKKYDLHKTKEASFFTSFYKYTCLN